MPRALRRLPLLQPSPALLSGLSVCPLLPDRVALSSSPCPAAPHASRPYERQPPVAAQEGPLNAHIPHSWKPQEEALLSAPQAGDWVPLRPCQGAFLDGQACWFPSPCLAQKPPDPLSQGNAQALPSPQRSATEFGIRVAVRCLVRPWRCLLRGPFCPRNSGPA